MYVALLVTMIKAARSLWRRERGNNMEDGCARIFQGNPTVERSNIGEKVGRVLVGGVLVRLGVLREGGVKIRRGGKKWWGRL
jgi:hypothetical protein